jgi:hypothetical protein
MRRTLLAAALSLLVALPLQAQQPTRIGDAAMTHRRARCASARWPTTPAGRSSNR